MQMITTPAQNALSGHDLSSAAVVTDAQLRAVAYTVHHAESDRYSVVTLDGRWIIPGREGYKARGAATRYVRANAADLIPSVPVVEPARCTRMVSRSAYGTTSRTTCHRDLHITVSGSVECSSCHKLCDSSPEGFTRQSDLRGSHTLSWVREYGDVERRANLLSEAAAGGSVDSEEATTSGSALAEAREHRAAVKRAVDVVDDCAGEAFDKAQEARQWMRRACAAEDLLVVRRAASRARQAADAASEAFEDASPYGPVARAAAESAYVAANSEALLPEHIAEAEQAMDDAAGDAATCDEFIGQAEDCARQAQEDAGSAEDAAAHRCTVCGGFTCACYVQMVAVLSGEPVPMTDVERADAVPVDFECAGQMSLEEVSGAPAGEACAEDVASVPVDARYSLDVDAEIGLSGRPG
ncbi:hypothetical protein, partial [Bacillus cereus]|uniref:hypothetical protein n=1 Tax=Bacillus cereus TaxID=1396 RepID=UPI00366F65F6